MQTSELETWRDRKWKTNIQSKNIKQLDVPVNETCLFVPLLSALLPRVLLHVCLFIPLWGRGGGGIFGCTRWAPTHHLHQLYVLDGGNSFFFIEKWKKKKSPERKLISISHAIFTHYLVTVSNYREL